MNDISRYKRDLRQKERELRDLLCSWDPIGVMGDDGAPRDEYDCFMRVIGDLRRGVSEADLVAYFEGQLRHHFGLDPRPANAREFGRRVFEWYWSDPLPGSLAPT